MNIRARAMEIWREKGCQVFAADFGQKMVAIRLSSV